jgi:hypothetical protein
MNRTIYIGLMALPIYLYNSGAGFAGSRMLLLQPMNSIMITHNTAHQQAQSHRVPWEITARDDQPEDCLRLGICKD